MDFVPPSEAGGRGRARQARCNNIDIHINSSNTTTINKELFSKYLINLENLGFVRPSPLCYIYLLFTLFILYLDI